MQRKESWSTKITRISNHLEDFWHRYSTKIEEWLGFIGGPFIFYAVFRLVLHFATEVNQVLGLVLSIVFFIGLIWIVWWFWRHRESSYKKYSSKILFFSLLASIILMATAVVSSISFILYELDAVAYTSENTITAGGLADFYLWHFADSIPFLEIGSTFDDSMQLRQMGR